MTSLRTFSLTTLLIIIAIIAGFFAGQRRGYDRGLAQWQSLPSETVTWRVKNILPNQTTPEAEIENLIDKLKTTVIPEFCREDPRLTIEADGDSAIRVHGNVVVLGTIGEFLTAKENVRLNEMELTEADKVMYFNAKRVYLSLKDKFEPED